MDIGTYATELSRLLKVNEKAKLELAKVKSSLNIFDPKIAEESSDGLINKIHEQQEHLTAAEKRIDEVQSSILNCMKPFIADAYLKHGFPDPFDTGYDMAEQVSKDLGSIGHFDCNIATLKEAASYFAKTFPFVRGYKENKEVEGKLVRYHHLLNEVRPFVHNSFELARNLDMYKVAVRNRSLLIGNMGFGIMYAAEAVTFGVLLYLSCTSANSTTEMVGVAAGQSVAAFCTSGMTYMFAAGMQGRFYTQLKGQAEKTQNLIEKIKEA